MLLVYLHIFSILFQSCFSFLDALLMNLPRIELMSILIDRMTGIVVDLVLDEIMEEVVEMVGYQDFRKPYPVFLVRIIQSMLQSLNQNSYVKEG